MNKIKKKKKVKVIENIFLILLTIQILSLTLLIVVGAMPSPSGFFGGLKAGMLGSVDVVVSPEMWGQIVAAPLIFIFLTSFSYNSFKNKKSKSFWISIWILLLMSLGNQFWLIILLSLVILVVGASKDVKNFLDKSNNNEVVQ